MTMLELFFFHLHLQNSDTEDVTFEIKIQERQKVTWRVV